MKMILGLKGTQNCNDVKLDVFVNQNLVSQIYATTDEFVTEIILPETPAKHMVEIVMFGKNKTHTTIDHSGNIISDVAFIIETLKIQDIDMKPIFCQGRACYIHSSNNPHGKEIVDELYDYIGFNGKIQIEFFTPIYLWMSEYF